MYGIMFRGIAVGITETIPGVSGSTIAMTLGVYERLIYSLNILTTKQRKTVLPFLFIFGVGMAIGFTFGILFISFLLKNFRTPTLIFFVGIIVGFLPYLGKETFNTLKSRLNLKHYIIFFSFLSIVVIGQLLGSTNSINLNNLSFIDYLFFGISGLIASTALMLPGISGALILTIFGIYDLAVESLKSLHFSVIFSIGFGIILGILISSKLIQYLLKKFITETYIAMMGLVSGSIYAILFNIDYVSNSQNFIFSLIAFFAGISSIVVLQKIQRKSG